MAPLMRKRHGPYVFADPLGSVFNALQRAVLICYVLWKGLPRSRAECGSPSPSYEGVALRGHIVLLQICYVVNERLLSCASRACQPPSPLVGEYGCLLGFAWHTCYRAYMASHTYIPPVNLGLEKNDIRRIITSPATLFHKIVIVQGHSFHFFPFQLHYIHFP